jgi:hypothetical protein
LLDADRDLEREVLLDADRERHSHVLTGILFRVFLF